MLLSGFARFRVAQARRYRLAARTQGSQPWNRGSIPRTGIPIQAGGLCPRRPPLHAPAYAKLRRGLAVVGFADGGGHSSDSAPLKTTSASLISPSIGDGGLGVRHRRGLRDAAQDLREQLRRWTLQSARVHGDEKVTMRMHMRRFTRLTDAFSKKFENHAHMVAIYTVCYTGSAFTRRCA